MLYAPHLKYNLLVSIIVDETCATHRSKLFRNVYI